MSTRRPPEERRQQIFEATGRLIGRHGLARVSMIAVAEEAGLSRRLVYDHFADLAALLREYSFVTLSRALTPDTPWAVMPVVSDNAGDVVRQMFRVIMSLDAEQRTLVQLIRAPRVSDDFASARTVVEQHALARWRQYRPLSGLSDAVVATLAKVMIDMALDLAEAVDAGVMTEDGAATVMVAAGQATVTALCAQNPTNA